MSRVLRKNILSSELSLGPRGSYSVQAKFGPQISSLKRCVQLHARFTSNLGIG